MILSRSKDSIFLCIIVHTCLLTEKYSALQDNSYFFNNRRLKTGGGDALINIALDNFEEVYGSS